VTRPRREIAPGAVYVPDWLSLPEQRRLVTAWRRRAQGPVPMRSPRLPNGSAMSVQMVCLGWHWQPYRYTRTADDAGGDPVAPVPAWLAELGKVFGGSSRLAYHGVRGSFRAPEIPPPGWLPVGSISPCAKPA
jgi:hypothetical protein